MLPTLSLFEDSFRNGETVEAPLPARPRMLYVVHGSVSIDGRRYADGEAWYGEGAVAPSAGATGATVWRWELAALEAVPAVAPPVRSARKHIAALETLPPGELLLRGDSVTFGPGGCAYRHVHQGPGIRCLLEGGIRIDVHGESTSYGPGGAWFEAGPDPVFAQAADRPTRFIRVMILPRALLGKSSIRYVDDADCNRPKTQVYQVLVDAPIAFPGARA